MEVLSTHETQFKAWAVLTYSTTPDLSNTQAEMGGTKREAWGGEEE